MKSISAIIIDDETDAIEVLMTLIKMSGKPFNVVGTSSNLEDGVSLIKHHKPDVVFLDVEMPKYAGYEIAKFFEEISFEIVFVTAFDQYAIKAFELSAVDYLMKPIMRERLNATLDRLTECVDKTRTIKEYELLSETIRSRDFQTITIPELAGKRVINLKDIICIQGQGSYSMVFLVNNERLTVSKNLKFFEAKLPEKSMFFRSQKSWIVNLTHIQRYNLNHRDLFMLDNIVAKISKHTTADFLDALNAVSSGG